jgi:hypothetical protein
MDLRRVAAGMQPQLSSNKGVTQIQAQAILNQIEKEKVAPTEAKAAAQERSDDKWLSKRRTSEGPIGGGPNGNQGGKGTKDDPIKL